MRAFSRLCIVVVLFAWSFVALAKDVPDLEARYTSGQVRITWSQPTDGKPDFYHVYYGRQSILQNEGTYDDFEKVDGRTTTIILSDVPQATMLYVAVLPVNTGENTAVTFTEEAVLPLTEGGVSRLETLTSTAPSPEGVPTETLPDNVQNLEIKSEQQPDGRYVVVAAWDAPRSPVASYQVLHSVDNGATFSEPQAVGAGARFVRFTDVPPGQFRIQVRTVSHAGALSAGASAETTLAAAPPRDTPPSPSLPADLTSTGAGLFGLLLISGAAAGWRKAKKR